MATSMPEAVAAPPPQTGTGDGGRGLAVAYAATIFLSAFLLFEVQPLVSRLILPWFGGTPGVWTTCLLFFQLLLFGGYAYSHLIVTRLRPAAQAALHAGVLLAAAATLPILPAETWKPTGQEEPTLRIVTVLAVCVGLPFFALSTTGPLLQGWFSRTHRGTSPYRLYALSNVGSLLALVTYPFVVEPLLGTEAQAYAWSGAFAAFGLGCGACAVAMARHPAADFARDEAPQHATTDDVDARPSRGRISLWFALAMVPSALLVATTNQVCLDVASVPFLWILPLTLYLLTFILCFDSDRWYSRRLCVASLAVLLPLMCVVMFKGANVAISMQVVVYFGGFFVAALVCHGELARLKPHPRQLTRFYLTMSAGGAAGGMFVGAVAPLLFPTYLELNLALAACAALALLVTMPDPDDERSATARWTAWWLGAVAVVGLTIALTWQATDALTGHVLISRSFYGVLRVKDRKPDDPVTAQRQLLNGRILHGSQFLASARRHWPTTYYAQESGVGLAIEKRRGGRAKRVGVVGLGVGTLAAYGTAGDSYRFYEINADVERIAQETFHFLDDSAAVCTIVLGDARLSIEREEPQRFDVLAIDAFSGDAIPVHLLTDEAFDIYRRHLADDGVLAIHISNRHFELAPVVAALAEKHALAMALVDSPDDESRGVSKAEWMLLSPSREALTVPAIATRAERITGRRVLWTDDHANVFAILRSQKDSLRSQLPKPWRNRYDKVRNWFQKSDQPAK